MVYPHHDGGKFLKKEQKVIIDEQREYLKFMMI